MGSVDKIQKIVSHFKGTNYAIYSCLLEILVIKALFFLIKFNFLVWMGSVRILQNRFRRTIFF